MKSHASRRYQAFAVTAPGLAPLAAAELRGLGLAVGDVDPAGVPFDASMDDVWRANLWLRTASRVVVRLAHFRATAFHELERFARQVPWSDVLAAGRPFRLRVTCRKSRLYHSDAVAERVAAAIQRAVGDASWSTAVGDDEGDGPEEDAQLFVVRFSHDRCTISSDTSGALLHRRGYRESLARAPLRETLAAATLLASGWDASAPLVDPMCGSGTIPIEGALLARRIAPGRHRPFAFAHWPNFDPRRWSALLADADTDALPTAGIAIIASDRDAGAVRATTENAERAGVLADLEIVRRPLSALELPDAPHGWIVTNPPYGKRVGERDLLGPLYAAFGDVVRLHAPTWTAALLSADPMLERRTGLSLREALATSNGGIPVRLVTTER